MADASVTLVRDQSGIVPLDVRRLRSAHVVMVLEPGRMAKRQAFSRRNCGSAWTQ